MTSDLIYIEEKDGFIVKVTFEKKKIISDSLLIREAYNQIDAYFKGELKEFDLPFKFIGGTEFQKKVWNEISKVSYGTLITYKELANGVGSKAYRAVGSACGKNPIGIIVPCHRVVSCNGIGGFGVGIEVKRSLLKIEGIYL